MVIEVVNVLNNKKYVSKKHENKGKEIQYELLALP